MLISIIVPVYKVENYLNRCIESIVNQTYKNIEIILVDDGSPDNCGEICESYAKIDSRIRVIHKKNGGLSDARNTGLKQAKGDYIMFVDADDYVELDGCENFVKKIFGKDIDIAMGDITRIFKNIEYKMCFNNDYLYQIQTGIDFFKHQLINKSMNMASCRNIYRRSYILEKELFFLTGILHEDEEWLPRVLLGTDKVITTGINFYKYIIREDSITQKKNKQKNAIDLLKICFELETFYKTIPDDKFKELANEYLMKVYLNAFYTGKLYKNSSREYLNDMFLIGKAKTLKSKIQVGIYRTSKRLFYLIYHVLS